MRPEDEISAAFSATQREEEEQRMREQYRRSMRILCTIPSGTPDEQLTEEQRQAWRDHDAAIAWMESA